MASFMPALARIALIAAAVGGVAIAPVAQDRSDEAHSWQAAWETRQAQEAERREAERIRRDYERRRAIAHARMRSQPDTMHASRPNAAADAMCPVVADPEARREFQRELRQRREEAFRRATGLPLRTGLSVHPVPKRSGTQRPTAGSFAMSASSHPSPAATVFAAASSSSADEPGHMVPLFPSASDSLGRQGFARVINHGDEAGEVTIEAFDDQGTSYGPLTLTIATGETIHFNSADLENGNAGKGLSGSTGPGEGDWRLELDSGLDIEVLSYIRTGDGFLTAMHDTAPEGDDGHRVAIFNPGSNTNQESLLRLVNRGDADASITITGTDDKGSSPGGGATAVLAAHSSVTYTAAELESGNAEGLTGSIGDGSGKWRLTVRSVQDIVAMSLLSSPTGHLTNLSTAPDNETGGKHSVPLFPSASDANGREGFLRVVNHGDEAGEVAIAAFDDTDREYETLTLAIGANEAKHFNSDDLELGNAGKGLTGSTGAGEGDWRLELTGDLDIEVLAYIRTTDGFLTAIHDPVPRSAKRHRVAVFNPGSNANQMSELRLVNAGPESARATVTGVDDRGESPGDGVAVTVPAGGSASYTAAELESGNVKGLDGSLGDGSGKWQLTVNADRPIIAMSLLSSPTGHLTNLSTAPERGAGPVETAAEAFEALISPVVQTKCVNCHVEGGSSAHTPLVFVKGSDADNLAQNRRVFEDYVANEADGASRILNKIQGAEGHGGGTQVAADTPEFADFQRFLRLLGAEVEESVAVDLFEGVTFESTRRTLWRAAIVLAGRTPTESEYASIEGGSEDDLRMAIRELMECPEGEPRFRCGFHEFLIRGANDRLLTDRELRNPLDDAEGYFYDYTNKMYRLHEDAAGGNWRPLVEWEHGVDFGAGRAPLELIAHVVEEDLRYTEILAAPYVMANPMAAEAYGAPTEQFEDSADRNEFRPSEILSYYRKGKGYEDEEHDEFGLRVLNPGPLLLADFPHAGVLSTKVFLQRYPTTPTNRNRARSRWTYYHFLGDDIENSESRTMDPEVLKDTNNPTLHNPKCTACHARMDPVAGAYQNYGEVGLYRPEWGGLDALDRFYKEDPSGRRGLPLSGRSWADRNTVSWTAHLSRGGNTLAVWPDDGFGGISLDRLDVVDESGELVQRVQFEDLPSPMEEGDRQCGENQYNDETGEYDYMWIWGDRFSCAAWIDIGGIVDEGVHTIEVVGWSHTQDDPWRTENGVDHGRVQFALDPYRTGDTWYRGMRKPGFVDGDGELELVPGSHTDRSLQWLAKHIVEDSRFAEAAVKFWWPAIMGSEVLEQPLEADDPVFRALDLAARAQRNEVNMLAAGFRDGFGWSDKGPYNAKDLLVEIAMSNWFRAETLDDPLHRDALRHGNAGARRLLTPEELARKTAAVTGFQWGRQRSVASSGQQDPAKLNWLADPNRYGLLYGGIDSDGITERARDVTSVMAAVANAHALSSSCPIVLREFYLLPDGEKRLFANIDRMTTPAVSPVAVVADDFEVTAENPEESQAFVVGGEFRGGSLTVRFTMDRQVAPYSGETWTGEQRALEATAWPGETVSWDVSLAGGGTNVAVWPVDGYGGANLDRVALSGADGEEISRIQFEDLPIPIEAGNRPCGEKPLNPESNEHDHMRIWGDRFSCAARFDVDVDAEGDYALSVLAWGDEDSGGANARLALALNPEPAPVVVRLDRLEVLDEQGQVVYERDLNRGLNEGSLEVPAHLPTAGTYNVRVRAWASNLGEEPGRFEIAVEDYEEVPSEGATTIRNTLAELHTKMFGIEVEPDSPDIETAYRLFFDVWQRKRETEDLLVGDLECDWHDDHRFLDGLLDDAHVEHTDDDGWDYWEAWDWDRSGAFVRDHDLSDPLGAARAWVVVLTYLLTDYRYLYL